MLAVVQRPPRRAFIGVLGGLFLFLLAARFAHAEGCQPISVGVDSSLADNLAGPIFGEADGQVFLAEDTLLTSITVWRIAAETGNSVGMHLYIARADSTGVPIPDSILLDGPTVTNAGGDGIHPVPFRFEFDPPLVLPGRGHYYFAVQADPCGGFFNQLMSSDHYGGGTFWISGSRAMSPCHLSRYSRQFPLADMVFTMEFCRPATAAAQVSWGAIKASYR